MKLLLVFALFLLTHRTEARWRNVETIDVPAERVLTNLTRRAETETNNFELLHALARVHSLSYARASSNWSVPIATNAANPIFHLPWSGLPWFGHDLPLPPKSVTASTNSASETEARKHVLKAIEFYKRAIEIAPTNEFVLLGLGWCQIQAGQTNDAKSSLRRAVQLGQNPSIKTTLPSLYGTSGTEEAIGYLIPLLDPIKDDEEKRKLENLKSEVEAYRRSHQAFTPLALSLQPNLDLSALVNTNAVVAFDMDGLHIPGAKWQWITTNAAWIVHLPQGGRVTSAMQMFGNVTFWMFWENGYHALASLDDNADGLISGDELRGIKLWHDRDCDGVCAADEILELSQLGIVAFDTRYTSSSANPSSANGVRFMDGSTRPTYDVILDRR